MNPDAFPGGEDAAPRRTIVTPGDPPLPIARAVVMGSCFSTEVGGRLAACGIGVCLHPFGILFNPASILASLRRLEHPRPFTQADVIGREGRFVSFHHHGAFARDTPQAFLEEANESLKRAAAAFAAADTVILTFGTSWVFRHLARNRVVSNCHKVPAREFRREFLPAAQIAGGFAPLLERHGDKQWIFTVSPIRHLADGAHGNQLSKANLLLAVETLRKRFAGGKGDSARVRYFPAYEILLDELRDYEWYAPDGVHPSPEAAGRIADRFLDWAAVTSASRSSRLSGPSG